ncbi:MAG: hypothetical protein V4612_07675 [Pseudomonadota bacterium]
MKQDKQTTNNKIWYNFFIRSANSFVFDLLDGEKDLSEFSTEQVYNMVAVCDNVAVKSKVFKCELEKRIELGK